jgi:hypothetical protein
MGAAENLAFSNCKELHPMSTLTFRKSLSTVLGTAKLGGSLDGLLNKAKQLDAQDYGTSKVTNLDVNGDGVSDGALTENLDANGKITSRSLYFTVNGASFAVSDNNADGKVDSFQRIDASGSGLQVGDNNLDGKADFQAEWTGKGTNHYFYDNNGDGKIDQRQDTRKATSKDQFVAAPVVAGFEGAQLGSSLDALIPAGAKQISWNEGPTSTTRSWDTNGDWLADVTETQNLDANRQVIGTQVTLNQPAKADGTPGDSVTLTDSDNDGKADSLWGSANGQWFAIYDNNRDGKMDGEELSVANGGYQYLADTNNDGKADQVTTWSAV